MGAWDFKISLLEFEENLQRKISELVPPDLMRAALDRRAELMAHQVAPHLIGESLADIGCGDGLIAWLLRGRANKIILTDVHCYLDPRVQIPLYGYKEDGPLPINELFDTTLLLTVLHHAQDPIGLVREVKRITRQRIIIIESIFGVVKGILSKSDFYQFDFDRQRKYATFIDWLYNRIFHDGVPVPYNFNTPRAWEKLFRDTGLKIQSAIDLGIDQPLVPEYHFLFVIDVEQAQ